MPESYEFEIANYRLERADNDLASAELLLNNGLYKESASSSYYAIFHAIRALFALENRDYKKHSAVISNFQKDYIKTGIFPVEFSDIVQNAFQIRNDSDYSDFYIISKEDVANQLINAKEIVSKVKLFIVSRIRESL